MFTLLMVASRAVNILSDSAGQGSRPRNLL